MPIVHPFMPVIAVLRETTRKNVLSEFFFLELADSLSIALADVEDHAPAYRSSTARVYRILSALLRRLGRDGKAILAGEPTSDRLRQIAHGVSEIRFQ